MVKFVVALSVFLVVVTLYNVRRSPQETGDFDQSIDQLKSLPYLEWSQPEDKASIQRRGVVLHNSMLSQRGLNLYKPHGSQVAHLIDMQGRILNSWSFKPKSPARVKMGDPGDTVEIAPNGDLFAVPYGKMLAKLDWNSSFIWKSNLRYHHDLEIAEDGLIYAISRERLNMPYKGSSIPILDDLIVVLSAEGKVLKKLSLFKLFGDRVREGRFQRIVNHLKKKEKPASQITLRSGSVFDILHTNSIEIVRKDISGFGKKGDLLISIRELDLIAVVDIKKDRIVWSWGNGKLRRQHHPSLLNNGNVLVFDNRGNRGKSRVLELNPVKENVIWRYQPLDPTEFFTGYRGGVQRLANGNTLITESDRGRVFEITSEGEVVWEFLNPKVKEGSDRRACIYRMIRLSSDKIRRLPFDRKTRRRLEAEEYL